MVTKRRRPIPLMPERRDGNPAVSEHHPVAVVFEGDLDLNRAATAMLRERGFAVTSFDERPPDLVSTVRSLLPEVVVLELAMAGVLGLELVTGLLEAVPGCAVVLLSPFETLRVSALAAGAFDLVGSDLRTLDECLRDLERSPASPSPAVPASAAARQVFLPESPGRSSELNL